MLDTEQGLGMWIGIGSMASWLLMFLVFLPVIYLFAVCKGQRTVLLGDRPATALEVSPCALSGSLCTPGRQTSEVLPLV